MSRPDYGPKHPEAVMRWTVSDLETYLRCGIAYRLDTEAANRRSTVIMAIGTAIHEGARKDAEEKIQRKAPLKAAAVIEASVAAYEAELEECEIEDSRRNLVLGKDAAAGGALEYVKAISPLTCPENVLEAETSLSMLVNYDAGQKIQFSGRPDRVEVGGIADTKTGREWGMDAAMASRQLTAYGWLRYAHSGEYPRNYYIDNLIRGKRGWEGRRLTSTRTQGDLAAFGEILYRATRAVIAGVELPAPSAAWYCSKKWCPHWHRCPAVIGRRPNASDHD